MSNVHFSKMPNINIPRTKMKQNLTHSTSFNFADLVPIDCFEVIPGDSFSLNLSSLIRMSQPIAPLMDTIEMSIHAFFIPLRLVYKDTEKFFGANKTSAGPQRGVFQIPQTTIHAGLPVNSVSSYLGKPAGNADNGYNVSLLKERCYWLTWSEWYRAQQVQTPFTMTDSDDGSGYIGHIGSTIITANQPVTQVCKKLDYFTACTILPQYGDEVLLPLGSSAPLKIDSTKGSASPLFYGNNQTPLAASDSGNLLSTSEGEPGGEWLTGENLDPVNVGIDVTRYTFADLSAATAASVNQIRYAFAMQKYLERCNYGTRYFEVLSSHYGVTSPDARLQRPEYLGGQNFLINIQQVLSTAGATTGSDTKLGQPGANSTTAYKGHLFSKGFVEFGYVLILASTRQGSHKYSQGVLREDLKKTMWEFYTPEMCNLGDQEITKKELMVTCTDTDDDVFGYQEHWAEYRYRKDLVTGILNPNVTGSLDYWTLANKFASQPSLNEAFVKENRENIKRCLVTGATGPDFIADFYFDYIATREMPAYTIPGLIDHFGTK